MIAQVTLLNVRKIPSVPSQGAHPLPPPPSVTYTVQDVAQDNSGDYQRMIDQLQSVMGQLDDEETSSRSSSSTWSQEENDPEILPTTTENKHNVSFVLTRLLQHPNVFTHFYHHPEELKQPSISRFWVIRYLERMFKNGAPSSMHFYTLFNPRRNNAFINTNGVLM